MSATLTVGYMPAKRHSTRKSADARAIAGERRESDKARTLTRNADRVARRFEMMADR